MSNSVKDIFQVENSELMAACGPAFAQFQSPAHMNELAKACAGAFNRGHVGAYFVPAVDLAVGTAIRVCSLPSVRNRWPNELFDRVDTATYIAGQIASSAAIQGFFVSAYRRNHYLRGISGRQLENELSEEYAMQSLCESPFLDGVVTIGGANLMLQNQTGLAADEAVNYIADSRSFPLFAQLKRNKTKQVKQYLGRPYACIDKFEVDQQNSTVEYTADAKAYMRRYVESAGGCPAVSIRSEGGDSVYEVRWREMVRMLLSKNVTISRHYRETKSRRAIPYNLKFGY